MTTQFTTMREFILREARKDALEAVAKPTDPKLRRLLRALRANRTGNKR